MPQAREAKKTADPVSPSQSKEVPAAAETFRTSLKTQTHSARQQSRPASTGQPAQTNGDGAPSPGNGVPEVSPQTIQSDAKLVNGAAQAQAQSAVSGVDIYPTIVNLSAAESKAKPHLDEVFEALTGRRLLPSQKDYDDTAQALSAWGSAGNAAPSGDTRFDELVTDAQKKAIATQRAKTTVATQDELADDLHTAQATSDPAIRKNLDDQVSDSVFRGLTSNLGRATERNPLEGAMDATLLQLELTHPQSTAVQEDGENQTQQLETSLLAVDPTLDTQPIQDGLRRWRDFTAW